MIYGSDDNPNVGNAEWNLLLEQIQLARRCTQATQNLWRVHRGGIERTTKEALRSPRNFQKGFATGVSCLIAEFHRAGVDVNAVLKEMGL